MPFVICDLDGCCDGRYPSSEKRMLAAGRMYRGVMIVRTQPGAYIQRESDFQTITFVNEDEAMLFVDAYHTLFGGARDLVPEDSMLKA